jgi:hypothetical protein
MRSPLDGIIGEDFLGPITQIVNSDGLPPVRGENAMEFRLLYQGILRANGGVEDKFSIRRQLHPQLKRFWTEHPLLKDMCWRWGCVEAEENGQDAFDMGIKRLANTHINGFTFLPLSRKEWHLRCSIDVLFLRREKPGNIFMRGDIDNRLKTIFDALQMPRLGQDIGNEVAQSDETPFYILLQDDELIADVSVTTDRLLAFPEDSQFTRDYAVLVINVKLQPTQLSTWSRVFQ